MTTQAPVVRGIQSVRAEASTPTELIEELGQAFKAFREKNDARVDGALAEIESVVLKVAALEMGNPSSPTRTGTGKADARTPVDQTRAAIAAHYATKAAAAGQRADDVSISDVFRAVAGLKAPAPAMAALAGGTDSTGGYTLPSTVAPKVLDALVEQSALMQAGMGVEIMGEGVKSMTVAGIDDLPVPEWRAELAAVAASDPSFRGNVITPRNLAVIVRISRELLADGVDMDRAIRTAVATAFAAAIDRACLIGSGTAPEPRGLENVAGIASVAQSGAAFGYGDVLAALQKLMLAKAAAPTGLIVAPATAIGLAGLVDTTGQPLRKPDVLAPVPTLTATQLPVALGTGADESIAFLGDFRTTKLYVREALTVQVLREAYAGTGEIGFLCHVRCDFAALYPQAIAMISGVK